MKLRVNDNEIVHDADSMTVKELLETMRYSFPLVIVKVNEVLVPREDYASAKVKDGDSVDAYHLVSGG